MEHPEEEYCPICGVHDPKITEGQHHCKPQDLQDCEQRLKQLGQTQSPKTYGQQLKNGFDAVNPYGDSDY